MASEDFTVNSFTITLQLTYNRISLIVNLCA